MNAANEEVVQAFIEEIISFADIPALIEYVMDEHKTVAATSLEVVLNADHWARQMARKTILRLIRKGQTSVA